MRFVPLESCRADLGPKAARLRELTLAGYPVPETYVLPDIGASVDVAQVAPQVAEIMLRQFAGCAVVVRSSAGDEDRPLATAAGVYDSYLGLRSVAEVLRGIELCAKSAHSASAAAYRRIRGETAIPAMSVMIQRMIDCESSGVMFTRSPLALSGMMLVEATPGWGTSVVAGTGVKEQFGIRRRGGAEWPDDWRVDPSTLADRLSCLGHLLEARYGRPQDVEWGVADGRLYVFQSRDATIHSGVFLGASVRPVTNGVRATPLSPGYAAGVVGACGRSDLLPGIPILDEMPTAEELEQYVHAGGLLVRNGNVLCHSAALCREQRLPVVLMDDPEPLRGLPVLVDACAGCVTPLCELDAVNRKKGIFAAMRQLGARGSGGYTLEDKYETVIFDPAAQAQVRRHLRVSGIRLRNCRQRLFPYDDPDRTYCGISARVQTVDGHSRLQFKRANVLPDRPFRFDEEVHLQFGEPADATEMLNALGYVPFTPQERDLERASIGGVALNFSTWPGAPHSYLGIESSSPDAALQFLAEAGVAASEARPLDGKELFEMLDVRLDHCVFVQSAER